MAQTPSGPLAVSLGDPAGIGPEVVAKCWDGRSEFNLPPFVAIGDPRSIAHVWDGPIELIDDPRQADSAFDYGLPLIQIAAADGDLPGQPSVSGAHCSLDSLEIAPRPQRSVEFEPCTVRLGLGGCYRAGLEGTALRDRIRPSGSDRVRC